MKSKPIWPDPRHCPVYMRAIFLEYTVLIRLSYPHTKIWGTANCITPDAIAACCPRGGTISRRFPVVAWQFCALLHVVVGCDNRISTEYTRAGLKIARPAMASRSDLVSGPSQPNLRSVKLCMLDLMSFKSEVWTMLCATLVMLIVSGGGWASDDTVKSASQAVKNHSSAMVYAPINITIAAVSAVERRAPKQSEKPSPVGQDPARYVLAFSEEFDNGLNASLWNDHIWYEKSNPTKNYEVSNGTLKIWPERDATGKFVNRILDTDGHFSQAYGYYEMEVKLPMGKGVWPAFWLYNHLIDNSFFPEIDIMEAYPGGGAASGWSDKKLRPTAYGVTSWPMGASGPRKGPSSGKMLTNLGDLSAGFHKYGLKWEAHKQTFYFDGKEMYSVNVSMSDPLYILFDIQFGSASGMPDDTTPSGKSNSLEINYVRTWKFK